MQCHGGFWILVKKSTLLKFTLIYVPPLQNVYNVYMIIIYKPYYDLTYINSVFDDTFEKLFKVYRLIDWKL